VFEGQVRRSAGPIVAFALPNGLAHLRMGLSVPRRVGTAPRRNRIKRLLREAYRTQRQDLPVGYDLVLVVRPHVPLALVEYQTMLVGLIRKLDEYWQKNPIPQSSQPPQ